MMNIEELISLTQRPKIFTKGTKQFWVDEYISKQVLIEHLNASTDLGSYKHETINKIVEFIIKRLELNKGRRILDAGCGPGLYCERFAKEGFSVQGIDFSNNSIEYAKRSASDKNLSIEYTTQDYLEMNFDNEFDCILNISLDFCVLSYESRETFLKNIHKALKPGGFFILDIMTPFDENANKNTSTWSGYNSGFWSPNPHVILQNRFYYEKELAWLDQYIVIEDNSLEVYRVYSKQYTYDLISKLLTSNGFEISDVFEDLTGKQFLENSKTIGIIARKVT